MVLSLPQASAGTYRVAAPAELGLAARYIDQGAYARARRQACARAGAHARRPVRSPDRPPARNPRLGMHTKASFYAQSVHLST